MDGINKEKVKTPQFIKKYFRRIYIPTKKGKKGNKNCNIL